jgi:hypothetical protein
MVAKYGKDNADFIVESMGGWLRNYTRGLYLEMGIMDEQTCIDNARAEAEERGWEFELRSGEWSLLKRLFYADWDDDFVVVPPGSKIVARNDESVLAAEPVEGES